MEKTLKKRPGARILLLALLLVASGCGKQRTLRLLTAKRWKVTNVTPPRNGNFDIEDQNQAQAYKEGVYRNAWFEFSPAGIFRASFDGKVDSGKYRVSGSGKLISLYPLHADTLYEQIQIQVLDTGELDFNTLIASFYMTLHCKPIPRP